MKRSGRATRESAEILGIQALAYLAEDGDRLSRFLGLTGIEADDVRAAARQPGFLAGVLEHMLGDESLLVAFADSAGIDPAEIARARSALGGIMEHDG